HQAHEENSVRTPLTILRSTENRKGKHGLKDLLSGTVSSDLTWDHSCPAKALRGHADFASGLRFEYRLDRRNPKHLDCAQISGTLPFKGKTVIRGRVPCIPGLPIPFIIFLARCYRGFHTATVTNPGLES